MFKGVKNWHCRLSSDEQWYNFTTNNPKVTVEFTASHFLGWNRLVSAGNHTVYVKDLATQEVFKVVFCQHYEQVNGERRGRRETLSVTNLGENAL